jgi:hypothetical protein
LPARHSVPRVWVGEGALGRESGAPERAPPPAPSASAANPSPAPECSPPANPSPTPLDPPTPLQTARRVSSVSPRSRSAGRRARSRRRQAHCPRPGKTNPATLSGCRDPTELNSSPAIEWPASAGRSSFSAAHTITNRMLCGDGSCPAPFWPTLVASTRQKKTATPALIVQRVLLEPQWASNHASTSSMKTWLSLPHHFVLPGLTGSSWSRTPSGLPRKRLAMPSAMTTMRAPLSSFL